MRVERGRRSTPATTRTSQAARQAERVLADVEDDLPQRLALKDLGEEHGPGDEDRGRRDAPDVHRREDEGQGDRDRVSHQPCHHDRTQLAEHDDATIIASGGPIAASAAGRQLDAPTRRRSPSRPTPTPAMSARRDWAAAVRVDPRTVPRHPLRFGRDRTSIASRRRINRPHPADTMVGHPRQPVPYPTLGTVGPRGSRGDRHRQRHLRPAVGRHRVRQVTNGPSGAPSRASRFAGPSPEVPMGSGAILDLDGLHALVDALRGLGYRVIGPTLRDGALVLAEISSPDELPRGIGDEQTAGRYRTHARDDESLFGTPPRSSRRNPSCSRPTSGCGAACEQGRESTSLRRTPTPTRRPARDPRLRPRRDRRPRLRPAQPDSGGRALCGTARPLLPGRRDVRRARGTCFCASMDTGPRAERRLRPRAHRNPRRGRPPIRGRGRGAGRGAEVLAAVAAAARSRRACRAPDEVEAAHGARWAARCGPTTCRPAVRRAREPPLGRRRRALPELRQLHDGVPHVLLHDRGGRHATWPATTPSARGSGTPASPWATPTLHGGSVRTSTRAGTGSGSPTSSPPGPTSSARRAASAAGAASPGARRPSTSPRRSPPWRAAKTARPRAAAPRIDHERLGGSHAQPSPSICRASVLRRSRRRARS